jgi:tetratricopeptide (TPR) repeat protein
MSSRLDQLLIMLNETPQDDFLRYAVAVEYSAAGNNTEAISRIESLIADKPDYLGAYYKLGQLHEQNGSVEKALDVYRRGAEVAKKQNNTKTLGEINTAIMLLED